MSLARYGARRGAPVGCWVALAGLGLLLGVGLAAGLALPRVAGFAPLPGSQSAASLAPVRITFSRPMDHAAVEAGLRLEPNVPGRITWEGNTLVFTPAQPWPLGSAVTVTLAAGRSQRGLPLLGRPVWTFTIGQRRLAYLAGSPANLWVMPLTGGGRAQALTAEPQGIYDYAVSPDGSQLVYAARRADGGADLRAVTLDGAGVAEVLACPGEACLSPTFSPDGARLAYQRQPVAAGPDGVPALGEPRIHVLTLGSGADQTVAEPPARAPRWAPDGRLSYLDTRRSAVVVQDLATGAATFIPTTSGDMGAWSPDGQFFVYPELYFPPEPQPAPATEPEGSDHFFSHLLRITLATNAAIDLSAGGMVDDGSPAFAPSGAWLAFGRRALAQGQWSPGRQAWLMRPDGSQAQALTDDPLYNHSAFRWSPGSTALAYMRFNTAEPAVPAEIWIVELDPAGQGDRPSPRRLVAGYLPEWLP